MDSKVLVTGADGFIGSHLTELLINEGYEVVAFCFYNSFSSWGWLDSLPQKKKNKLIVIMGDIRDANRVKDALKGVDIVFHLAALIGIPFSYHSPSSYLETNVNGTFNILQAARELGTERILITSTSEVYGTANYIPIDEKHPRQGQSPYSATKIAADYLAESYYRSFGLPISIVRPFNTYGPRQSARAIIPTIITQLLSGRENIKLGDLSPTRDLVYVKDTVQGFLKVATCADLIGTDINIATERETSMQELAEKLIQQINPHAVIVQDKDRLRPKDSEVFRLLGTSNKLYNATNWKPAHSLSEGLAATIDWFKEPKNIAGYKPGAFNL